MNTSPKLARNVRVPEPHPEPQKKFRILWANLVCQILMGVAFGALGIVLIQAL